MYRAIQLTVGNGRFYGGGNVVHEDAHIVDRRLHLFGLEADSLWRLLLRVPLLRFGKHRHSRKIFQLDGQKVTVSTGGTQPLAVHADGEPTTETPVTFAVHPHALRVMAPPETAARLERQALAAAKRNPV